MTSTIFKALFIFASWLFGVWMIFKIIDPSGTRMAEDNTINKIIKYINNKKNNGK